QSGPARLGDSKHEPSIALPSSSYQLPSWPVGQLAINIRGIPPVLRTDPSVAVRALRSAAPYIRMYKGKVFVIKASGGVFGDSAQTRALIEQVAILHQVGIRVVLVHGGRPQLTQIQEALGVAPRLVRRQRVADE